MSILSVDTIQPIGSGTTITLNAAKIVVGTGITFESNGQAIYAGIITATSFVGNLTGNPTGNGANLTNLPAANLTGTLPAISGANLTALNIVTDTSPQLGGNLDLNGKQILVGDGGPGASEERISFGNSEDLKIYHDGNSVIYDNGAGNLILYSGGASIELKKDTGEEMLVANTDGSVDLYHDDVKVVKTNSWGMQVGAKATSNNYSHNATDGWALADGWTKAVFTSNVAGNSPFTIYNAGSSYNRYMCYFKFDGGFANYSGNDLNLCDERVKKDFADVPTQWDNIKNIGFKHFRYKEDSSSDPLKIGVVAQQVESVYPDLIDESWPQENGNPNTGEGDFYKGVKEEQLLMYSVKALQEAQTRIETLEAEVAALKSS